MKTLIKVIFAYLFFTAGVGMGAESIKTVFDFGLEGLAKESKLRRNESPVQTFYSSKPKLSDEHRYVYWPEARFLLRLPNDADGDEIWQNMIQVARFIDMETDLVTKREDIGTSTYLELESDVVEIVRKCLDGSKRAVLTGAVKRGPAPTK
jgi:hypothetical protein